MASKLLWGWDSTNKVWVPLSVDANGRLKLDMTNISLNDLANVSVAAPADGDLFYYDDATSLWKSRKLVDADIPAGIARDSEVTAAVLAEAIARAADVDAEETARISADSTHAALETGVHGVGSNYIPQAPAADHVLRTFTKGWTADKLLKGAGVDANPAETDLTYDLCEYYLLPYLISRHIARFMHIQFDSYDMITEYIAGTGYTGQNFFQPQVRPGATSGGEAALYQNAAWLYIDRPVLFAQHGHYPNNTRDGTGFLGLALVDNTVIAVDEVTKHAGFVFYSSGATQTVYAQSGDGVGVEKTDLSVAPETFVKWSMIGSASSIKFYRNWTLVATHTTRIPAGALCWKMSIKSAENLDGQVSARNFVYAQVN